MKKRRSLSFILALFSLTVIFAFSGCDVIYKVLEKEGAQEKRLLGDIPPGVFNPVVKEIQTLLNLYGYNCGKPDGKLGPKTRNAIQRFKAQNGLKETKYVDNKTWDQLNQFNACGLVVEGEIDIKAVQVALYNAGFDPGKIDGKLGKNTIQAVRDFQRIHDLKADGKVGYKTLTKLKNYLPEE